MDGKKDIKKGTESIPRLSECVSVGGLPNQKEERRIVLIYVYIYII